MGEILTRKRPQMDWERLGQYAGQAISPKAEMYSKLMPLLMAAKYKQQMQAQDPLRQAQIAHYGALTQEKQAENKMQDIAQVVLGFKDPEEVFPKELLKKLTPTREEIKEEPQFLDTDQMQSAQALLKSGRVPKEIPGYQRLLQMISTGQRAPKKILKKVAEPEKLLETISSHFGMSRTDAFKVLGVKGGADADYLDDVRAGIDSLGDKPSDEAVTEVLSMLLTEYPDQGAKTQRLFKARFADSFF